MRIIAAYRSPPRASIFIHETRGQEEPAMSKRKLAIVSGSIRPNRFGGMPRNESTIGLVGGSP
jgi:hypothetical protein